jgi:hypothetical protein
MNVPGSALCGKEGRFSSRTSIMLHVGALVLAFGFAPSLRAPLSHPLRVSASAVHLSASCEWSDLDTIDDRESTIQLLDTLKEDGKAPLWKATRLAPRSVSLQELSQTTKLSIDTLNPTGEQFSIDDISSTFFKVLAGATAASFLFALVSDAAGLDAGMRFTGTYLIAGIPIGVLAIGSLAPGILFLPFEWFKSAEAKQESQGRVAKHEAAHLLTAHCLGIPVADITVSSDGPRVIVYDEEAAVQPGTQIPSEKLPALSVVALSGLMAEADAYGKALGAGADLNILNQMLMRATPPLPANERQGTTRCERARSNRLPPTNE